MITKIVSWLALVAAVLSFVAVISIMALEMYVRWKLNQNFTFLGGEGLAALTIASFGLILGLSFIHRT